MCVCVCVCVCERERERERERCPICLTELFDVFSVVPVLICSLYCSPIYNHCSKNKSNKEGYL